MMTTTEPFVTVPMILGPTASGKSACAMALAAERPIEIISCDSAQVYCDLDLGTAKPSEAEQAAVKHHLINIVGPTESYSAARFVSDVGQLVPEIVARGNLPVIVGGTMLYIKALTQGLHDLPTADAALRAELEEQAAQQGWPAMHARLRELDPTTAARLKPTDAQRIQRALEICLLSGQPMSELLAPEKRQAISKHIRFANIALEPSERAQLHQRIAHRFGQMLDNGLIEEVQALRKRGDLSPAMPSMRCVGYRQVWAWLDAGAVATERQAMIDAGVAATRQLAKRQLTWLRSMTERKSIDCLAPDCSAQVAREIARATL